MITTHVLDIDPDMYCYDTKLTFGSDAARQILKQIQQDDSAFAQRNNYYAGSDYRELTRQIGAQKTREIIRRQQQITATYPGQTPISFKQYFVRDHWAESLLSVTPDWLKVSSSEPDCMLQVGQSGDLLPAHCGHHRKCSLFMLLQGEGQETCWYRPTEDFELIDPLRIPDLDKVEKVVSVVMEPGRWYLFNHAAWHSVHRYSHGGPARINIGIDYHSIEAEQLLNLVKKNAIS
jgi:hypothetical protein